MSISRPKYKNPIQEEIDRLLVEAESKVLAGEAIQQTLTQIEQLKKLLELKPVAKDQTRIWAVSVAILCLVIVTSAAAWRVPSTRIQLDLEVASVSFLLASELQWSDSWPVSPNLVRFKNVERAELPDFPKSPWTGRVSFDVEAIGGFINIRTLNAQPGAAISIDQSSNTIVLSVNGAPSVVRLFAGGTVKVSGEDAEGIRWKTEEPQSGEVPLEFGASGNGSSAVPASILVSPLVPSTFRGIAVSKISFVDEQEDGGHPTSISKIVSGSLMLTDVRRKVPLSAGEMLQVKDGRGQISVLEIRSTGITLRFEGRATGVSTGQGDFRLDLRPSILDFAYHQERIGFVWGAITALWGLLWSTGRLIGFKRSGA